MEEAHSEADCPAIRGVSPSPGFLPQDVIRVIAAAMGQGHSSISGSLRTEAFAMDLSIPVAEDVLQLEGGVHCWVDGLPTLVGTKEFVRRLGIEVPHCLPEAPHGYELFAARGRHLIGWIAVSQ